jgi:hypothetical protein
MTEGENQGSIQAIANLYRKALASAGKLHEHSEPVNILMLADPF